MNGFFQVKNFKEFQHYKDRNPPWIKLYNKLLDDYDFGRLPDASKAHLLAIWLLASRYENKIPCDAEWVARKINATEPVDLSALAGAGFIVLDQQSSIMLAHCKHDASEVLDQRERQRERDIVSVLRTDADASPLPVPVYTDSKHELWGEGVLILIALGVPEKSARSNIGRWLRDTREDPHRVLGAIQRARDARIIDPVPWITRAIQTAKEFLNGKASRSTSVLDAADEIGQCLGDQGNQADFLRLPKG